MNLRMLSVDEITVQVQHRKFFDPALLEQLITSVREQGILQPLLVCPQGAKYQLIAGERRLRAARQANLSEVPAYILEVDSNRIAVLSAMENLQRENLNPLEEVDAVVQLCAEHLGLKKHEVPTRLHELRKKAPEDIAQSLDQLFTSLGLGHWKSFVSNRLPLLNMPEELKESVANGELEYTKARKLATVKDDTERAVLLDEVVNGNLTSAELGRKVREVVHKDKDPQAKDPVVLEAESLRHEFNQLARSNFEHLPLNSRKRVRKILREVAQIVQANESKVP